MISELLACSACPLRRDGVRSLVFASVLRYASSGQLCILRGFCRHRCSLRRSSFALIALRSAGPKIDDAARFFARLTVIPTSAVSARATAVRIDAARRIDALRHSADTAARRARK